MNRGSRSRLRESRAIPNRRFGRRSKFSSARGMIRPSKNLSRSFKGNLASVRPFTLFSMHHFQYSGQDLHCESVDLAAVAKLYGTPTYVYSAATMEDNLRRLQRGLDGLDVQICYAMKANSNIAVLRHFANLGAGF